MRLLSVWLIVMDSEGHILKAAFSLGAAPVGFVHTTTIKSENKDTIVHWYGVKPTEIQELNIEHVISDWLVDGRLV